MKNELTKHVLDCLYRARWYFLISFVFSFYISVKVDTPTAILTNCILNIFAAIIGANDMIIEALSKITEISKNINDIHLRELVDVTSSLSKTTKVLESDRPNEEKIQIASDQLNDVVASNIAIINSIKSAKNGAQYYE
jgi:hypothetical protein